ncbi:MAG: hypothetical protein ACLTXM_09220 [Enterococcus sp.]
MRIFGLTLTEVTALIAIAGSIIGLCRFAFNKVREYIVKPMVESNKQLSFDLKQLARSFKDFTEHSIEEHKEFRRWLNKHDDELIKHEERLKTLFNNQKTKGENEQ